MLPTLGNGAGSELTTNEVRNEWKAVDSLRTSFVVPYSSFQKELPARFN